MDVAMPFMIQSLRDLNTKVGSLSYLHYIFCDFYLFRLIVWKLPKPRLPRFMKRRSSNSSSNNRKSNMPPPVPLPPMTSNNNRC